MYYKMPKNEIRRPEIADITKKLRNYPDMVERIKDMYYYWKRAQTDICKNCRHYHYVDSYRYPNGFAYECEFTGFAEGPNDFCSHFKIKEECVK